MTTYRRSDDALGAPVGDTLVVLNLESLKYFELNAVSGRIWEILDAGAVTEEEICETLCAEFTVSVDECKAAVMRFMADAESKGLVSSH